MPDRLVPASTETHIEEVLKEANILPTDSPSPTPTYVPPGETTDIIGAVSDTFTIVLGGLVNALATIFTQAGILLVLIIAGLGFAFVYWAIRLIHLRGR